VFVSFDLLGASQVIRLFEDHYSVGAARYTITMTVDILLILRPL
jgi:hypothetical protein